MKETVLEKPQPPQNCSLINQNRYYLQIFCEPPSFQHSNDDNLTYLLQVYDANTRLLLGTTTSNTPSSITITSLPRDHDSLLLFVRSMTGKSIMSDAAILYAPSVAELANFKATGKESISVFCVNVHLFGVRLGERKR